jgi:hypothetical protein
MLTFEFENVLRLPVVPALVAGIHAFLRRFSKQDVDGRDEPGHDGREVVQYDRNALQIYGLRPHQNKIRAGTARIFSNGRLLGLKANPSG